MQKSECRPLRREGSVFSRRKVLFAEAAKPIEFDIIENMKTYPLFGEKVKVDALSSRHD